MMIPIFLVAVLAVCNGQDLTTSKPMTTVARLESQKDATSTVRPNLRGLPPQRNYQPRQIQPIDQERRLSNVSETNANQPRRLADIQTRGRDSSFGARPDQPGASNFDSSNLGSRAPKLANQLDERLGGQARPAPISDDYTYSYRQPGDQDQTRRINPQNQPRASYIPDDISYRPYSFNYVSEAEDGSYNHQQSADGTGKVIGSYSFALDDGRRRVVEYIADHNGFRANIDSNEPGMSFDKNPADVVYYSSAGSTGRNFGDSGMNTGSVSGRPSFAGSRVPGSAQFDSSRPATGNRGYAPAGGPQDPNFTSYRSFGTDAEFRSDAGRNTVADTSSRGMRRPQIPGAPIYADTQGAQSDVSPFRPSNTIYQPSAGVRRPQLPQTRRSDDDSEGRDEASMPRPDIRSPQQPEMRFEEAFPIRDSPTSQQTRGIRPLTNYLAPEAPGSARDSEEQPRSGRPMVRSYFNRGPSTSDNADRRNSPDFSSNLGPAMTNFFNSRSLNTDGNTALSGNVPAGADANSGSVNDETSQPQRSPTMRGTANQDNRPFGIFGGPQQAAVRDETSRMTQDNPNLGPISNDQNVPLVEYHALHPDGSPQYFYSLDNGNYWFHRH